METFDVIWKGETVGKLEQARNDMGILEGKFAAVHSDAGQQFLLRASAVDSRAAFRNETLGARASIVSSLDPSRRQMTVIIFGLEGADLALRLLSTKESIARVEANVNE